MKINQSEVFMEKLFTIREVAKILKTNVNFVYYEIDKGKLPYVLIESKKIRENTLNEYIKSNEVISSPS